MPWRAMTYKVFNTFVDDLFAFLIEMPTAHRLATLRDDVVFFIYLYQMWIYPVDKTRANEFGYVYETDKKDKKEKPDNTTQPEQKSQEKRIDHKNNTESTQSVKDKDLKPEKVKAKKANIEQKQKSD